MEDEICPFFKFKHSCYKFLSYFLELQTNEMLVNDRWLFATKQTEKIGTSEMSLVTNSPPTLYPFPFSP